MVEAGLGGDVLVARDAALIRNGRNRCEREDGLLGDMHPELPHGDDLVGEPRGHTRFHVAIDTADVGVRTLFPCGMVGTHLMTGGVAEGWLVGRQSDTHGPERDKEDSRQSDAGGCDLV
jgi:hypothetical protein